MLIKYKCSNGDGTYSQGYLRRFKQIKTAKDYLVKIFHSVEFICEVSIFDIKHSILEVMKKLDETKDPFYSGYWHGYSSLSDDTGFEIVDLKKAMKKLHEEKEVELLYTSNDESRVAGRGWFLCGA